MRDFNEHVPYVAFSLLSSLMAFSCAKVEYTYGLTASEYSGGAGMLFSVVSVILAIRLLKHSSSSTLLLLAVMPGALPLVTGTLLTQLHAGPNVHGFSFPAFIFYGLLSEICAFMLSVASIVHWVKNRSAKTNADFDPTHVR